MRIYTLTALLFVSMLGCSCGSNYSPKPRGYFKIDFPEKRYQSYKGNCPYMFDYPTYARVAPDSAGAIKPCWLDVTFPQMNAKIHLSYQEIHSKEMFNQLVEDARTFAFKHTSKATAIDEGLIAYPDRKVYGIFYSIDGNAASSAQFFLTDSTKHYLRGALYFHERPQLDSIQPVLDFIRKDVDVLIKSIRWK